MWLHGGSFEHDWVALEVADMPEVQVVRDVFAAFVGRRPHPSPEKGVGDHVDAAGWARRYEGIGVR